MAYSSEFDLSRHRNGLNHFQIGLGIAFYFIIIALAFAAVAQPVTPRDQNFEGLLFKTTEPGKFLPAPLLATEVKIDVTGPIARTNVRQYFINPTENWLEGIYIFPLPDKSAVDSLKMRIGERIIEGVIKEKKQARRIYDKARAQGKRAALLSSQRPNIFTTSVANIGPKQGIIIEFTYQEMLPFKDGRYTLRFPMVVGPGIIRRAVRRECWRGLMRPLRI